MQLTKPSLEKAEPVESIGASFVTGLKQLLGVVRRRKALLCTGLVLAYACGALYYFSRDFLYEARASVLVHRTDDPLSGREELGSAGQSLLPTHIKLITSSAVLNRALEKLKAGDMPAVAALTPAELADRLAVSILKDTEILVIAYQTTDRTAAVPVVEAVVAAYLEFINEVHHSTSKEVLQILCQQKDDLDRQLRDKEHELLALQQSAGVLTLGNERGDLNNEALTRMTAIGQALTLTQTHKLQLGTTYREVKAAIERGEPVEPLLLQHRDSIGPLAPGDQTEKQTQEANSRRELLLDELELRRLQGIYGLKHPKVTMLEEKIRLGKQLMAEDKEQSAATARGLPGLFLDVLQHDLAEAVTLEQDLQKRYDEEKTKALDFVGRNAPVLVLQTEVARLSNYYEAIADRIRQVNLGEDTGTISTEIVEPPEEPMVPVSPNLKKVLLACSAGGLLFGLGLCYLFELWDTSYRSPEDISEHLGLPVLGNVPWVARVKPGQVIERIMEHSVQSVEAESFRTLRAALMLAEPAPRRFTVTSPEAGDGKTCVLANLAIAFAQSGLRTLLVDADMRRPRLRQIFQTAPGLGLSHLLQQGDLTDDQIARAIWSSPVEKLDVLPSGPNPPNPAELLTGPNVAKLIAWAGRQYDRVVFDAPPILAVSDCAVLGRLLDGALLVVRVDRADRMVTSRAHGALQGMSCPVLGVVVNGVRRHDLYGSGYYRKAGYYTAYQGSQEDDQEEKHTEAEGGEGGASDAPRRAA